ncbi:MAG TPA: tetratricopeptide repeat protein, partial [Candidatus Eisenbacteria bacterium]|nr:tetratricopeptide repeat protein [Candidatus Eisenbacteria bacterium]
MEYLLPILLVIVLSAMFARVRTHRPAEPEWSVASLTSELDRLEALLLKGDSQHSASSLSQIDAPVSALKGVDGHRLRARLHLVAGDFFAWTSRPDPGRLRLEQAFGEIDMIGDDPITLELRARAEAALGLLASADAPDPQLVARAVSALEREPGIRGPDVLMRLVWVAHRLAEIEHQKGHWPRARVLLERSVTIARRLHKPGDGMPESAWDTGTRELFWSHGRRVASEAARDLAMVLESLGDREGTMRWLDEAVEVLEGATLPVAKLRLAQALIERATHEPVDAFTGIAGHEALLERAATVGLSCGTDDGRTVACMAESARANLYPALGMSDLTIQHLRRAMDLTGHMTEPASGYNQTYLHMRLGFALEEDGDSPAAIDSLQKAVDRGREHPDPDARKLAAQAAYRLHQLLAEAERLSDARSLVEVIEGLVPGLGAADRPTFVAMAAHCRGIQQMLENHADDARRALEQTESMAQQSGAVALARAAAVDLGRLAMRLD